MLSVGGEIFRSTPGKASKQEDGNIELEQQINAKESKVLQSEMKEVEPVEEVLLAEPDQDVMEKVKKQKQSPITLLSEVDEKYLSNEARVLVTDEAKVCIKQEIHTHCDDETMSRKKRMKVVELDQ